MQDQKGK